METAGTETEKLGLALSGGGFRAAFFHVGVLARLAEIGLLPKVEVISTVSGGSIVGAAYYLRLRRLLNEKSDEEITGDDYVRLVIEVDELLRDAVGKDIRGRLLAGEHRALLARRELLGEHPREHPVALRRDLREAGRALPAALVAEPVGADRPAALAALAGPLGLGLGQLGHARDQPRDRGVALAALHRLHRAGAQARRERGEFVA